MAIDAEATRSLDTFIQNYVPKFLLATIFFFLIYLINYFSGNFSFIFVSNISLQNIGSLSFNFYFLAMLTGIFMVVWIITIYKTLFHFFNSKFDTPISGSKINFLFKCDVVVFAFTMYIFLNYFLPNLYLLFGLFSAFQVVGNILLLNMPFFPTVNTYAQYSMYISSLLLVSVEFLALSGFVFFILHAVYYFHRKIGLNDFLSWTFTTEIGKAFLFFFAPFTIIYLVIWYDLVSNIFTKLVLLVVLLSLILYILYKITSSYYYGIANSWVNNENSFFSFTLLLIVFYIFPVLFWYIHDFIFLYFNHSVHTTILVDFQSFLIQNNLVNVSVFSQPWKMDPMFLLILTLFEIHRILFVDVFVAGLASFILLSYMQFTYILTYLKSFINKTFKEKLQETHRAIYDFNSKIQNNRILNFLFWIFVLFLSWDVLLVVYNTFIRPLSPSNLPDVSNYIIVYVIMNNLQTLQYPINYFSIFLVLLLFIAVLIVLNIVSIKLNENRLEDSFSGVLMVFSFSFVLVISYLIYDLQHYSMQPLSNFQLMYISNIDYSYYTVLIIGILSDTFLMVILLTFIVYKLKQRFIKPSMKKITTLAEEKVDESDTEVDEGEKILKATEEAEEKEENIIRNDVDF